MAFMNLLMMSAVSIRFAMRPQLAAGMCVKQFFLLLGKHLFSPIRLFGKAAGMKHRICGYIGAKKAIYQHFVKYGTHAGRYE